MSKKVVGKLPQAVSRKNAGTAPSVRRLTGQALLDDMDDFRKRVTATPESAREFLREVGVLTADGKVRSLTGG